MAYGENLVATFEAPDSFTELQEIEIPITFNGDVTGFGQDDFTLVNATFVSLEVHSPSSYTLTILPDALSTDIEITLAAGAVSQDELGRKNTETIIVIPFGVAVSDIDVVEVTTAYIASRLPDACGGSWVTKIRVC